MKTNKKRILFLLFAVMLIGMAVAACGDGKPTADGNKSENGQQNNESNGADSSGGDGEYQYPKIDGNGKNFLVLNPVTDWGFYDRMDFEEVPGEILDSAIYDRNRFIEDKFNIKIKLFEANMWNIYGDFKRRLSANLDVFDAAYMPGSVWDRTRQNVIGDLAVEGFVLDLNNIGSLNLEEEWWNQTMRKESLIGGKLFFAGNDIHLMTLQGMSCIYFNKAMMGALGLELPYALAREGKWTFDGLLEYQKAGTNLNGADMFSFKPSNPSVYGLVSAGGASNDLIMGAQEKFVVMNKDGYPEFAFGGDRFMSVIDKIHELLNGPIGRYYSGNIPETEFPGREDGHTMVFKNGKALMMMADLSAGTGSLRAMESDFGIVPVPKFDENQKDYYSQRSYLVPLAVIPFNSGDPEFAGAVLDAWAYKSYKDVTPVLFDMSVSHKGLRDDDSIEMLQIIRNSGSFCVGVVYGWTTALYMDIMGTLGEGRKFNAASRIEKLKDAMQANIDRSMQFFID